MDIKKQFIRYVSQNMLGMLGMSLYILADTYFISKAVGADGITALNLVLPVYNLIFAIGQINLHPKALKSVLPISESVQMIRQNCHQTPRSV